MVFPYDLIQNILVCYATVCITIIMYLHNIKLNNKRELK